MFEFLIAVLFLLITPGPGVLTTAGIGAAFGYRAGMSFLAGLGLGGAGVMLLVITGMSAAVMAVPWLRMVLLWVSLGYLIYLAWRVASAGSRIGFTAASKPLGFRHGFAMQFINPKAYVVCTTLFSGFNFLPTTPMVEIGVKIVLFHVIWLPVHLFWLQAGATLGGLNLRAGTQRSINFVMAAAMLAVVAIALWAAR